jgi:tetratricopeptide (TPR) repeat protein
LAADLLEVWEGVERALRALCGTPTLSGQSLIREARQREILTLDQAHALVEFSASCEKARETSYAPTWSDVQNAQVAVQHMASLLAHSTVHSAPVQTPTRNDAHVSPAPTPTSTTEVVAPAPRPNMLGRVLVFAAILALLGVGGFYGWQHFMSADAAMRNGGAAYAAGRRSEASHLFDVAIERNPKLALPHVYSGRMYREDGNLESASIEFRKAIELEPQNALALREMGSYLLAKGDFDLARAFYVRALTADQNDRLAMGYLACALTRLNRFEEAQRFLQRAGAGTWSSCAMPPAPR